MVVGACVAIIDDGLREEYRNDEFSLGNIILLLRR